MSAAARENTDYQLKITKNGKKKSIQSFFHVGATSFGVFFLRENPFNQPVSVVLLGILKAWANVIVGPLYPQNPASLCPRRADFKLQCQTKLNPIGTVVCSSLITSRCSVLDFAFVYLFVQFTNRSRKPLSFGYTTALSGLYDVYVNIIESPSQKAHKFKSCATPEIYGDNHLIVQYIHSFIFFLFTPIANLNQTDYALRPVKQSHVMLPLPPAGLNLVKCRWCLTAREKPLMHEMAREMMRRRCRIPQKHAETSQS